MHDDITSSKFTTKPRLYNIPCEPSTLFSFENTWMKLSQVYYSKVRLGGEIS